MPRSREEHLRAKREGMARLRAADPDAARLKRNAYHAANREAQTEKMRLYYAQRFFWARAMKLRGPKRASAFDLACLWKAQRGLCALTGRRLDRTAEVDHRLPKTRGGGSEIANLQWVTREANRAKRDMTDAEFLALCCDAMRWIGRRIEAAEAIGASSSLMAAE